MIAQLEAKAGELAHAYKVAAAAGMNAPGEEILRITTEMEELKAASRILADELQRQRGISNEDITEFEQLDHRADQIKELWRAEILSVRPTEDLDDLLETGLENLLRLVDPRWLLAEAEKPHRLGRSYLANPLHFVNGVRVGELVETGTPNRFAQMLLLSQDHLEKRDDLDFFSASTFLPEIATLGNSLQEICELGPEASRKLSSLGSMPDDLVTSTIYELLVGAAWVRNGHSISMVPEDKSRKVPDFRVSGLGGFNGAVECKRRLGLSKYELDEAQHVAELYRAIRQPLRERGINASIEACFQIEVQELPKADFIEKVLRASLNAAWDETVSTDWGSFTLRQLHFYKSVIDTRLYSPDFLQSAFGWKPNQDEWDGLLCEVDAPPEIRVGRFRSPLCIKWKSESETALVKKSRGILSLWASAVKQIPAGEIGFVYIAYPEGSRAAVADARTQDVIRSLKECWHEWTKRVPVTVVNRLFARPLGVGVPDLIENTLHGATDGQEFWFEDIHVPWMIFTRQFEGSNGR